MNKYSLHITMMTGMGRTATFTSVTGMTLGGKRLYIRCFYVLHACGLRHFIFILINYLFCFIWQGHLFLKENVLV